MPEGSLFEALQKGDVEASLLPYVQLDNCIQYRARPPDYDRHINIFIHSHKLTHSYIHTDTQIRMHTYAHADTLTYTATP